MLGSQSKILPLEDFSGGLRTRGGIYQRKNAGVTTPNCNAVISSTGRTLDRLDGWTKITSSALSGTCNGLFEYTTAAGAKKQIGHYGTKLYKMDSFDGTFDEILASGVTNDRSDFDVFTKADGTKILLQTSRSGDTMHQWNGADATMSDVSAAPLFKYHAVWRNRVFGTGHLGDQLKYSDLNDYETYSATNTDDNFGTPEGDEHTGLATLRGRLIVFKQYNIFRLSYLGGTPLFDINHTIAGTGCASHQTIRRATILLVREGRSQHRKS